jgi:carboxyl-terminal processing protease
MRRLVLAGTLSSLLVAGSIKTPEPHTDVFKDMWSLAETLNVVTNQSFRPCTVSSLVEEGLKAMVNKIDAHSAFFTPQSYEATLEHSSGQFHGIGASLLSKETEADTQLIVDVVRGGPADAAGLCGGDKIIEVDGTKLRGMSAEEVITRLRGKAKSTVHVTVVRDKKPLSVTVTRDVIKDRAVFGYHFPTQSVSYIAIKTFTEQTPDLVRTHLEKAYATNSASIVLDLRKNTGGIVTGAIKTAALFLPKESVVATARANTGQTRFTYTTETAPIHPKATPLFLVVDNFTASCAELLVGCLQHYARKGTTLHAFVVGMNTFGKGSVQEIIPLSSGCAVKLTTMLYALPSGECIQALGITPDFVVKPKAIPKHELLWVEDMYGKETSLERHITREEAAGEPAPRKETKKKERDTQKKALSPDEIEQEHQDALSNDHAIHMCLTLSNAYHNAREHAPTLVETCPKALCYLKNTVITDEPIPVQPL